MLNIAFFGSPEFSIPTLELLNRQKDIKIRLISTKPDQPAGRGLKLTPTPVKQKAQEYNLKILEKIPAAVELKEAKIDTIVVVAYGLFIPPGIYEIWPCLNLHPSLLPKYRGPSPLQTALLNGDRETGVTTMLISAGMDDGDILLQERFPLDLNTDIHELERLCAYRGAELILKTLRSDIEAIRRKQDETQVVICKKIKNEDSKIRPGEDIYKIHNKVRAIGGYVVQDNKRVKILKTKIINGKLLIETVQPEGKPPMSYADYRNGYGELSL